jgi:hypothetical protein
MKKTVFALALVLIAFYGYAGISALKSGVVAQKVAVTRLQAAEAGI